MKNQIELKSVGTITKKVVNIHNIAGMSEELKEFLKEDSYGEYFFYTTHYSNDDVVARICIEDFDNYLDDAENLPARLLTEARGLVALCIAQNVCEIIVD